ncbi:MAG: hypothetical protein ICV86_14745 [Microcoleus sp. T3-bin5]|nr:hypothetical protein [Microcoleus sp. T3-bin5]
MEDIINSPEHKQMLKALAGLPQHPVLRTKDQEAEIENQKKLWQWTAELIDYLQRKQLGFDHPDPLDDPRLHPLQRQKIDVNSCYRFSQLNLIIVGWDLIKDAAKRNRRNFPFNNPRELFTELCRQQAMVDISDVVSDEGENGGIGKVRDNCRIRAAFYRGKLEPKETEEMLETHRNSEYWENFIIYAVWEKRNSGLTRANFKMRDCWKTFLAAHKKLTAFWCNKSAIDNCRFILPKWSYGYAMNPQTSQRLKLAS